MEKFIITIDGMKVQCQKGDTVLTAAKRADIHIPTLCYLKEINEIGACRLCIVDIEGQRNLQPACVFPASNDMVVKTNTNQLRKARKNVLKLLLSNHDRECLTCTRSKTCELQDLAEEFNVDEVPFETNRTNHTIDDNSPSIVRDTSKCVLCGRCIAVCRDMQKAEILDFTNRGIDTQVTPAFNDSLVETDCISCGQCIMACPVGALKEKEDIEKVWDAIEDEDVHVVVQTAPAIRTALGEEFGLPIGTRVTGKMVTALKRIGFSKVFDTNFAADLTIMEEGYELLNRLETGKNLPLITSCSPGWVNYCEIKAPEYISNLSSCKSPHQMFGAIVKTYYAEKNNIDPSKIFVVSVMPCTAKKGEAARVENQVNGHKDVDAVITTRELAKMIKQAGIDFNKLNDSEFDNPLGEYSGAAAIFGATGGVMEAALRTVADVVEGRDIEPVEYQEVRGIDGVKEATIKLGGKEINVAVAHGTKMAQELLDKIAAGEKQYHFVEVMGCSGGCVTGGGQPHVSSTIDTDVRVERAKVLYKEDNIQKVRKSHKNPFIQKLYQEFLQAPNSEKAHKLLHTHYVPRAKGIKNRADGALHEIAVSDD
ncbi:NADH-dependent [FeFe] hydrogenase, group A6 [Proteinivorax tanatarense]|uniref:NADH-dependent [FeFe] hydrogenase, group A6 n=1 Tax=Proteinivorax tanatarense TaxID=1260629 RepID=A0AAU7VMK5_9FIRM